MLWYMNLTTLSQIATELGMDRSNARKYILKKGFTFVQVRDPISKQKALALDGDTLERLLSLRTQEGFSKGVTVALVSGEVGSFYLIQLIPELNKKRVKLGFSNDMSTRFATHRTTCPTAVLVKSWECKRMWEKAAMDSATRIGCDLIANEVYECDSVEKIKGRLEEFFSIMPNVRQTE